MDVKSFTGGLLQSLSDTRLFERVTLQTEGATVNGYAYPQDGNHFLRFYFNEVTGTIAFALIENQQRVWGIDYDNRRGWHLHSVEQPADHIPINPLSVSEIIGQLQQTLLTRK